jgi:hypothetical protein
MQSTLPAAARAEATKVFGRIAISITSCQCFARRVNVIAARNVVVTRFENPLSIKGPSTVHGVVFAFFVLAP